MSRSPPASDELGMLAKIVLVLGIALLVAGVLWYGVAIATLRRVWEQLVERPFGPAAFRFVLQPVMALAAAIRHGMQDARAGRSPYAWAILRHRRERIPLLREGLNATARIIALGIVMDAIYQSLALHRFYPAEAVIVALLLAWLPYVVFRGIVTRIALLRHRGGDFADNIDPRRQ